MRYNLQVAQAYRREENATIVRGDVQLAKQATFKAAASITPALANICKHA